MTEILSRKEAKARGLPTYFTGVPCKRGHTAERRVTDRSCCECKREKCRSYQAQRRKNDPEYRRAWLARFEAWVKANPEKVKEANRRWRKANREREKLRQRAARAANPERAREWARRWRQANRHRQREYDRRKRERDPEGRAAMLKKLESDPRYEKAGLANRRARKKAGGRVSGADLVAIKARAGGKCANCGKRRKLEYDHIIPLSRGGLHTAANLQMLCRPCNMAKLARDPIEWAQDNGRLL